MLEALLLLDARRCVSENDEDAYCLRVLCERLEEVLASESYSGDVTETLRS